MAQVACCPCANVAFQLTSGPDTAFHIQDDPRLDLHGFHATALPHSIHVTHPHLTSILDPDHCRLKWLVCGSCSPPRVVYGVENDDEQALPLLLLPLDHALVVSPYVLIGPEAEALPSRHPRYSPLFKVVVPTSRSFGPETPGTELTPDLRAVLTQLDATYAAHVAKESAAMEARIAAYRESQLAQLAALDAQAAQERDCLFAAAVRLRRGVTLLPDQDADMPIPKDPAPVRTVANSARPGLLPSSLGVSASINATATDTTGPLAPATAAAAMNPLLDVTLSASFRPTGGPSEGATSSPTRPAAVAAAASNRPRQRTLTGGISTAAANGETAGDGGDMFLFDDDDDDAGGTRAVSESATQVPDRPASPHSDTPEDDLESDVDDDARPVAKFGTSMPVSIPSPLASAPRSRQPSHGIPPLPPPLTTPVPEGDPPAPMGDGLADEDPGELAHVGHALPPHAYLAKTYAVAPGAFVVGSKPAGVAGRGFSFKG